MTDLAESSNQKKSTTANLQFGEEMFIEEAGFSFRPILGFELEVDGSVYMYSDDGNLEICLIGGELENNISIAALNDELAADFMVNLDEFQLIEAGKDSVQDVPCLVNEIRFTNSEEQGLGQTLICSPSINQFFFMLVIASAEHWQLQGLELFSTIKSQIHFHPKFSPVITTEKFNQHPDLTIESFASIFPEEDIQVSIIRGDISLLIAARTTNREDSIRVTEITTPGEQVLYHYDPVAGDFSSQISDQPIFSDQGEVCLLLPFPGQQALPMGNYRFSFATQSGLPLQEVQVIIRQGRALVLQKFDLNLWLALEDERFNDPNYVVNFEGSLHAALEEHLAPLSLSTGKVECFHPAPDELALFASVNIETDLADCSYMIAESVENGRALNVGLVDRFEHGNPPNAVDRPAISSGSPGMILSPTSPHACVLINYSALKDDFPALAGAIFEQLVCFCGLSMPSTPAEQPLALSPDSLWLLRRHPLFYDAA